MLPAQSGPCLRRLLRAEGRAVRSRCSGLVRGTVPDHRLAADQGRPVLMSQSLADGGIHRRAVQPVHIAQHAPAAGLETGRGVVREPVVHPAVNGNAVVVVQGHKFAQSQRTGQRTGLLRHAFHQAAVTEKDPGAVIDNVHAVPIEFRGQHALGQSHAHGGGDALSQRPCGHVHAGCAVTLGMPRRQ